MYADICVCITYVTFPKVCASKHIRRKTCSSQDRDAGWASFDVHTIGERGRHARSYFARLSDSSIHSHVGRFRKTPRTAQKKDADPHPQLPRSTTGHTGGESSQHTGRTSPGREVAASRQVFRSHDFIDLAAYRAGLASSGVVESLVLSRPCFFFVVPSRFDA